MGAYVSKYSKQKESEIRFTIMSALQELATFNGVDIGTIKETPPYSIALAGVTSQKMAAELKKLIESGMVVKGTTRGQKVKYMMRQTYKDLIEEGKITAKSFGYGDYRDEAKAAIDNEEQSQGDTEITCTRLAASQARVQYEEMW